MRLLAVAWVGIPFAAIGADGPGGGMHSASWDSFVQKYLTEYFQGHPDLGVNAGRHEFDGRLPDWSPDGLKKVAEQLHRAREQALKFDAASLDTRQQLERDYLVARVDGELFWREAAQWPFKNPQFYADISQGLDPSAYLTRPYAPLEKRMKAYIAYAAAVPRGVEQVKANLRTPMPKSYVKLGRDTFGGLASYLEKDVPPIFAPVKAKGLQADFAAANTSAAKAFKDLDAWFAAQEAGANDAFALGPELFSQMIRATEMVDIPLDQLRAIAKQDLDRNLAALREASAAYAPGKTVTEALEKMSHHKPSGGPIPGARAQLAGLKQFILEKGLLTIPSPQEAEVHEAPPYQRWNFAYIDIPGPYDKGLPSVYYIAPPDPAWSAAEQEAYLPAASDLLFTSVHEVWPGHFLQFLHSNRSRSKFGQVFVGYAFSEGWAHYAEEMMWEAGLGNQDPETQIGQLLNALLRNVRFLSAIGLHAGGMTVADSEKMFREQGFQDAGNARQQAARGTFDPAYLNYTMGKLMIRKLRYDWTRSRGGRAAWKAFHDEFLSYGGPPIPLVRKAMLGSEGSLF